LKLIATLHNRRGDPLLLLSLLKTLNREHPIESLGVAWSLPQGVTEPSWEDLVREEKQIQETLRDCVRMVHNSNLSWQAKSFLGRCYRSFQYEYMVALNLKRNNRNLRIILVDDPQVRNIRYKEIGNPEKLMTEIDQVPLERQIEALRSRYAGYSSAYEEGERYKEMVLHPNSALLEIALDMASFTDSREEYIVRVIKESKPKVVLLRLIHCFADPPEGLRDRGLVASESLRARLGLRESDLMKLSEAEAIVGPLPKRD